MTWNPEQEALMRNDVASETVLTKMPLSLQVEVRVSEDAWHSLIGRTNVGVEN